MQEIIELNAGPTGGMMPDPAGAGPVAVSIVIKTLNEERNIAGAIESSLQALAGIPGEVVVADSCSQDRTVDIASRYPVRVVQLRNAGERCCGIGPQLGFQHALGEFVYILDGDMRFHPAFIAAALAFLRNNPEVGGVSGQLRELNTSSLEYIARVERVAAHMRAGEVDRLDGGGLYRRTAVEQAGYFSDRNLHSYEELDLALRLRASGWKLWRLDHESVQHTGHDVPPYRLLWKRWRSQYVCGLGELMRVAADENRLGTVLAGARESWVYLATLGWGLAVVCLLLLAFAWPACAAAAAVVLVLPFVLMGWRKRSLRKACFSVVSWSVNALGLVRGFMAARVPPRQPIESRVLSDKSLAGAGVRNG